MAWAPIRCAVATLIRKVVLDLSTIASICAAGEIFWRRCFAGDQHLEE